MDRLPASKVVDAWEGEVLDIPQPGHRSQLSPSFPRALPFLIRHLPSCLSMDGSWDADCIRSEERFLPRRYVSTSGEQGRGVVEVE